MPLIEILAFNGVIGSGKTFQTEIFKEQGYININFADELKEMVWKLIGWKPKNEEEYTQFKNTHFINELANLTILNKSIDSHIKFTGRDILERYGQQIRNHNPDFFCDILKNKLVKLNWQDKRIDYKVVISDVRYINEAAMLLYEFNTKLLFCNFKSNRYDSDNNHESQLMSKYFIEQKFKNFQQITYDDIVKYEKIMETGKL